MGCKKMETVQQKMLKNKIGFGALGPRTSCGLLQCTYCGLLLVLQR
jgi:hypothetical protein